MYCDRVRTQKAERRIHIASVGVADVRALRVENHRNVRRDGVDVRDGSLQSTDTLVAIRLVERGVRLVGTHEVFRRFHDCAVECDDGVGDTYIAFIATSARGLGNLAELAVESDANEVATRPLGLQHLSEVSVVHVVVLLFWLGIYNSSSIIELATKGTLAEMSIKIK